MGSSRLPPPTPLNQCWASRAPLQGGRENIASPLQASLDATLTSGGRGYQKKGTGFFRVQYIKTQLQLVKSLQVLKSRSH